MYRLALKMLIGDRAKYIMLVSGLTFSALLMTQQCGVFLGLLSWTTSHSRNIRASIWVVDPKVEQLNETKPLRDTDAARVRSVQGVAFAEPLYTGVLSARLSDGTFKPMQVIGIDATTMIGRPPVILSGRLEDLRLPNTVMIDELGVERLSVGRARKIGIGDTFEINDREARIIGICRTDRHFFGYPYIYTTYNQALDFAPRTRKMMSMVLAEPAPGWTPEKAARQVEKETGLKAYTTPEFNSATITWVFHNTGIPASFMTTIILGFVVGIAVSGQTFYSFVLENIRHLAALKAMGASTGLLSRMLLLQAFTVGFIGYGIGVGLTTIFGLLVLEKGQPPFLIPAVLPVGVFAMVLVICSFAALL
ncbi:MAG TPA: ABC transporter permease, partial [Verrucomicrobiae bacterium]|nr:ABC transporter permease [Verrucomicrobiae bacterium]